MFFFVISSCFEPSIVNTFVKIKEMALNIIRGVREINPKSMLIIFKVIK